MAVTVRIIDRAHEADIRIPNEPFPLRGRFLVSHQEGKWSYTAEVFPPEQVGEMCFPDENYDFDRMSSGESPCVFVGAYEGETCIGLAVMQDHWTKYMYLYDLKVNRSCRGQGVGKALLAKCDELSRERGYRGIYTVGQDDNLNACLFYISAGFSIGGLDTLVYTGTKQEGKGDVYFYRDHQA